MTRLLAFKADGGQVRFLKALGLWCSYCGHSQLNRPLEGRFKAHASRPVKSMAACVCFLVSDPTRPTQAFACLPLELAEKKHECQGTGGVTSLSMGGQTH